MIRIVVDDRERAGGLARAIGRVMGRRPEVARLAVGDVTIGDRFVVERKEAADWVMSLRDGRLARQLGRLKGVRGAILIVEGEFSPRILRGVDPRRVRQAMLEVSLNWRIPLLHSRDVADTAH